MEVGQFFIKNGKSKTIGTGVGRRDFGVPTVPNECLYVYFALFVASPHVLFAQRFAKSVHWRSGDLGRSGDRLRIELQNSEVCPQISQLSDT